MPRQNRVTPFGEFEDNPARGLLMGNRGILHDDHGILGSARWQHKNWIACALSFKDRKAMINAPGHYSQLFFCDEATALAAGHRPCAECRRPDYRRFMAAWREAYSHSPETTLRPGEVDDALHRARITRDKKQVVTSAKLSELPDGTFISLQDQPSTAWLVWRDRLHCWSHEGYRERLPIPRDEEVVVLTPGPSVRVLSAGYVPAVHKSAAP